LKEVRALTIKEYTIVGEYFKKIERENKKMERKMKSKSGGRRR